MNDKVIIGMLRSYIAATLAGAGALKGAPCQVASISKSSGVTTVTLKWVDDQGVTTTGNMTVADGQDGANGVGISNIEKTSTSGNVDTYTITLTNGDDYTFTVTNGSGGSIDNLTDVSVTNLQDGQTLIWDSVAEKWVNGANSATVASLANIGDVAVSSATDGQVLEWDNTAGKWKNKSLGAAAISNSYNDLDDKPTIPTVPVKEVKVNGTALTPDADGAVNVQAISSVSVNGVAQTVTSGTVDLDVASNLITETQWTAILAEFA